MDAAAEQAPDGTPQHWLLARIWTLGIAVHLVALQLAPRPVVVWLNNVSWLIAAAVAAFMCLRTARVLAPPRRYLAWRLFGIGCGSWFVGQLYWSYGQLVRGIELPFPSVGQLFYSSFPLLIIIGILWKRDSRWQSPFTFKHVANVILVVCCLILIVALGLQDPVIRAHTGTTSFWIGFTHLSLVAGTFLVALYALWTYSWREGWLSMLLLVVGTGIYATCNLAYSRSVLAGNYRPEDPINVSWAVVFGFVAVAAAQRAWAYRHPSQRIPHVAMAGQNWVEAVVPALMLMIMIVVALNSRMEAGLAGGIWAAVMFIVFAIVLGVREAWIQKEAQHLTRELMQINEQMSVANAGLRLSESRYRDLNMALEQRVTERTGELKSAYDELEGFSYAVAHDLKAPLRAINSYAHLLQEELRSALNEDARGHVTRIRAGSLKMANLIDDLLAYSRADRRGLQTQTIELRSLIESILTPSSDEIKRRGVTVNIDVEPITLKVDGEGVALALRNLIQNALKYTRDTASPRVDVCATHSDAGLLITVRDNGVGFDMQYHDKIFKVFQRLYREDEYPGTGIGLALVRKAIDRIGGRVWAQSRPGEGATFYVELPASVVAG